MDKDRVRTRVERYYNPKSIRRLAKCKQETGKRMVKITGYIHQIQTSCQKNISLERHLFITLGNKFKWI